MKKRSHLALTALFSAVSGVNAQVTFDGSLGQSGELTGPNISIPAARGQQRGANLFHSFQQFNVNPGQSVNFAGPTNVRNVLARVTGGQVTNINGVLGCDIPNANLYLINPAGILFGQGAQLNVSGSFVASTADVIKFSDGGRFNSVNGGDDVLTTAPVSAFGFLAAQPQGVGVFGNLQTSPIVRTVLTGAPGKTVSIVAGPSGFSFGTVDAPAGRVNVVAVNGPGDVTGDGVSLDQTPEPAAAQTRGDIAFVNAANLSADGINSGAGTVSIRGANMSMGFIASIDSASDGPGDAGVIELDLSGELLMDLGASITSLNLASSIDSFGADIDIRANTLTIVNNNDPANVGETFSTITSLTQLGKGGDVNVSAELVQIGGPQTANITSGGDGLTGDLRISATRAIRLTGITSSINAASNASRAGNVLIAGGDLRLSEGARVFARAAPGQGGGRVSITGEKVRLTGTSTIFGSAGDSSEAPGGSDFVAREIELRDLSGFNSNASALTGDDNGGPISIRAHRVRVLNSSEISAATSSENGTAGSINITAAELIVDGANQLPNPETGNFIPATITTTSLGGAGGGTLSVNLRERLVITNGARVSAFTSDDGGSGGQISISAPRIEINGDDSLITAASLGSGDAGLTTINADTIEIAGLRAGVRSPTVGGDDNRDGRGGDIRVNADTLTIRSGAQLQTSTDGPGAGGNLNVTAQQILLDSVDAPADVITGFNAEARSNGIGGTIRVSAADSLTLLGNARITAASTASSASAGAAGDISITAGDSVAVFDGASIATQSAASDAGDIFINGGRSITIRDDRPAAAAPTAQSALDDTFTGPRITARAARDGGNITLQATDLIFLRNGLITAQTGNVGGRISIDPDVVVIDQSLIDGRSSGTPVPVSIVTDGLLVSNDSLILTDAPAFTVSNVIVGTLVPLNAQIADATKRLIDTCANRFDLGSLDSPARNLSSFIVEGRGGTPLLPGAPQPVNATTRPAN